MKKFNLRCYALIINDKNEILLSDENRFKKSFTKFIGGGLEYGEGTKECLEREILEELGLHSEIGDLFYVNDFFQQSAFNENDQIISFYFLVDKIDFEAIPINQFSNGEKANGEKFRWQPIHDLNAEDVTFPIDKIVVRKVLMNYSI